MLLSSYKESGKLFNVNLTGDIDGAEIYRGDLVLELGGVTERGDRKPPSIVARQGVLHISDDKINLLVAGLDQLADLQLMMDMYGADIAPVSALLVFVHDIADNMNVTIGEQTFVAVPLDDGMIWNEALELLCIEKSDLKGQSAEEKVVTLLDELKGFSNRYPTLSCDEALGKTIEVKASARGPV